VLEWLGFDGSTIRGKLASQARIMLFYYWACYNILQAGRPRFQLMKALEGRGGEAARVGSLADPPSERELQELHHATAGAVVEEEEEEEEEEEAEAWEAGAAAGQ
jgi:hypothetical protein